MAVHAHELVDRALALIFDELIPLTAGSHDPAGPPSCAACHAVHAALQLRQDSGGLRRRREPAKKRAGARRPRTTAAAATPPPQGPEAPPEAPEPPAITVGHAERVESAQQRHENRTGERLTVDAAEAQVTAAAPA